MPVCMPWTILSIALYATCPSVWSPLKTEVIPAIACDAIPARLPSAGINLAPIISCKSPNEFFICWILPASVCARTSFMLPTLSVMISANIAARSSSVPISSIFCCVSVIVMPTLVSAEAWPCIALPIMFAIDVMFCDETFTPFCWTARLFIAGISVFNASSVFKNVASCCAPDNWTSSPTTPTFWSAEA